MSSFDPEWFTPKIQQFVCKKQKNRNQKWVLSFEKRPQNEIITKLFQISSKGLKGKLCWGKMLELRSRMRKGDNMSIKSKLSGSINSTAQINSSRSVLISFFNKRLGNAITLHQVYRFLFLSRTSN